MGSKTPTLSGVPSKRPQVQDKALHIGSWLLSQGYAAEALPWLQKAQMANCGPMQLLNSGICYRQLGRFVESFNCLSVSIQMGVGPVGNVAMGMLEEDRGDFGVAALYYRRAHKDNPDHPTIALNYAMALLRNGEWEKAWPLWEFGRQPDLKLSNVPRFTTPYKQDAVGKSLLICPEGGYGDLIWLMRYFLALKERGFKICLWTWDSLLPLLEKHPWIDELLPASQGVSLLTEQNTLRYDYQIPLMSIPAVLGIIEPCVVPPYISAEGPWGVPPVAVERLALRNKRIGICWKAEETSTARPHRSLPDEAAIQIAKTLPGVNWLSLVPGEGGAGIAPVQSESDWLATARIMHGCDLIISVDTAVAHLAGAMGIPCWLLLPMRSDWRWGLPEKRFEWYPQMRMFTQTDPISWANVIEEVCQALKEL